MGLVPRFGLLYGCGQRRDTGNLGAGCVTLGLGQPNGCVRLLDLRVSLRYRLRMLGCVLRTLCTLQQPRCAERKAQHGKRYRQSHGTFSGRGRERSCSTVILST